MADSSSYYTPHQIEMNEEGVGAMRNLEYEKDVVSLRISSGLGKLPFAYVMQYQEDPTKFLGIIHEM